MCWMRMILSDDDYDDEDDGDRDDNDDNDDDEDDGNDDVDDELDDDNDDNKVVYLFQHIYSQEAFVIQLCKRGSIPVSGLSGACEIMETNSI